MPAVWNGTGMKELSRTLLVGVAMSMACTVEGPDSGIGSSGGADPCAVVCSQARDCGNSPQPASECEAECRATLHEAADISTTCGAAAEDLFECVGGLDCYSLYDYVNETSFGYPCALRDESLEEACHVDASSDGSDEPHSSDESEGGGSSEEGGSSSEDECDSDSDCGSHEQCVAGRCDYAQCTNDAHCSGCNRCVSNSCSYCGEGPYGCYC